MERTVNEAPALKFSSMAVVLEALKAGQAVIVVDEEDRENEGDFVSAAQFTTPSLVNFMISYGRGLMCQSFTPARLQELGLAPMLPSTQNLQQVDAGSMHDTCFMMSVDAVSCIDSGISTADRSITTLKLIEDGAHVSKDFYCPGHCFPLQAVKNGLEERLGHTEAVVDLMLLGDLYPSGLLCEILKKDGSMARSMDLGQTAQELDMPITHVNEILRELKRLGGRKKLVEASQYRNLYL